MKTYSHGKLLITGEYLILEGATGLAVPMKWGQTLKVLENQGAELHWVSKDHRGQKWFECKMNLIDFEVEKTSDETRSAYLQTLIKSAARLNSDFLSKWKKYKVTTELEFDPEWGLGSSSTLIANLANWAELSPFELYFDTQNGSGYDVAASISDSPLLYSKSEEELSFETIDWDPGVMSSMLVFYQGRKQDSETEVAGWRAAGKWKAGDVESVTNISESLADCTDRKEAMQLLKEHQAIMEAVLGRKSFDGRFTDFEGVIKPLGAWGGDFGLAIHEDVEYTRAYLEKQGLETIFRLSDIVVE